MLLASADEHFLSLYVFCSSKKSYSPGTGICRSLAKWWPRLLVLARFSFVTRRLLLNCVLTYGFEKIDGFYSCLGSLFRAVVAPFCVFFAGFLILVLGILNGSANYSFFYLPFLEEVF